MDVDAVIAAGGRACTVIDNSGLNAYRHSSWRDMPTWQSRHCLLRNTLTFQACSDEKLGRCRFWKAYCMFWKAYCMNVKKFWTLSKFSAIKKIGWSSLFTLTFLFTCVLFLFVSSSVCESLLCLRVLVVEISLVLVVVLPFQVCPYSYFHINSW